MTGDRFKACVFCKCGETLQLNGKKEPFNHEGDVVSFTCSHCIQKLLQMPQSKLIDAYKLAVETGYSEKASWLMMFMDEDTEGLIDVPETDKTRPNIVRKKTVRLARPSHH